MYSQKNQWGFITICQMELNVPSVLALSLITKPTNPWVDTCKQDILFVGWVLKQTILGHWMA